MGNPLFNKFGGNNRQPTNNGFGNLLGQFRQLQNNPGMILDILYQNGKINQQQYNEMQPIKNNPQQIFNYLSQIGNMGELNQVAQLLTNLK